MTNQKSKKISADYLVQFAPRAVWLLTGSMVLFSFGFAFSINILPRGEVLTEAMAARIKPIKVDQSQIEVLRIEISELKERNVIIEKELKRLSDIAHEPSGK